MAWMKIELELPDKPEVHYIAGVTNLDPDSVVGKLIRVWQWFDKHTTDGNAVGVTFALPDRISGVTGFGEAMSLAGWLIQDGHTLRMPKFDRHNGESAKKRALTAERVAKSKQKSNAKGNAHSVTTALPDALPREEKRRSKPPISPNGDSRFDEFWAAYPSKVGKGAAEKAWDKAHINGDFALVLAAIEAQKRSDRWLNGYIPNPATWLNQKRWLDEVEAKPQSFVEDIV